MATVVHEEASMSTVSENFPPAVLVIFLSNLGLLDRGTDTPWTNPSSVDMALEGDFGGRLGEAMASGSTRWTLE